MDISQQTHKRDSLPARVVIVGGGFGGLYAARGLARAPVDVTVVDKHNYHLFRPMLYQVATGLLSSDEVAAPIRSILRPAKEARRPSCFRASHRSRSKEGHMSPALSAAASTASAPRNRSGTGTREIWPFWV